MEYFLERIARLVTEEFGNTLNRHCLVFPGRRAGLYFMKYMAANIQKPVWAPQILTINELFRSYSEYHVADNEILLFELYKVYRKLKSSPESFDDFYFWGDMLLNDFDDADKYLVDASSLFRNINDIKTIDHKFGGLTEKQIEIIRRFWVNFNPEKPTNEKDGFLSIWNILSEIYSGFRNSLSSRKLAYEGMVFRDIAQNPGNYPFPDDMWDMVHFIGFNALNECEKVLLKRYKSEGKARIYWDYDNSYLKEGNHNSAGFFMRDNLRLFGNDMPSDWNYDTMISAGQRARRRVIEASSDIAQVKLVSQLIGEIPGLENENAHQTAVILADENLLVPIMTSLPENSHDINITMGYPLKQTLIYTLLRQIMDLQKAAIQSGDQVCFNHKDVIGILKHSLMDKLMIGSDKSIIKEIIKSNILWIPSEQFGQSVYLRKIFRKPDTPLQLSEYFKEILSLIAGIRAVDDSENEKVQANIRNEYIYRIILSVNRLDTIVNDPDVVFNNGTYIRILDRMLRIQSVPFSGEPLSGIQIMGILETRALDFKNLIIISANEGTLPSVSTGSSFIPATLREAFGLPSINHQESVYAYHFYRLLQRAENVTFTYNSNSEGLRSGEMSRFLTQMKYEPGMKPEFFDLNFNIKTHSRLKDTVEKTEDHLRQLMDLFLNTNNPSIMSPSAINTWIGCRMKFYFRYVNNLKEPGKITSEIDPALIGNLLHDIMRDLYSGYKNQVLSGEILANMISDRKLLGKSIDEALAKNFSNGSNGIASGNGLIIKEVILNYLLRILRKDQSFAPLVIINLEDSLSFNLAFNSGDSVHSIRVGGKVDRIDIHRDVARIVDYKTGTVSDSICSIEDLFTDDRKKDSDGWLQTLVYCEAYFDGHTESKVKPSVYRIRKMSDAASNDVLKLKDKKTELVIDDYRVIREEFLKGLKMVVSNIFSREEPFTMTADKRGKCSYCAYRALCLR